MTEQTPKPGKISLTVLPDPRRLERIFRNAEDWQRQNADEAGQKAEEVSMCQTEAPVAVDQVTADESPPAQPASPGDSIQKKLLEAQIIETLRTIYDPELPVNIYDLGLVYGIDIAADNAVNIRMTLTAPACPVAGQIVAEVQAKVQNLEQVKSADVELVWDPPWGRDMISDAAKLDLGLL